MWYKTAMSAPGDHRAWAKLAKHVIGLSNRKDGGYLLIGVEDGTLKPLGLDPTRSPHGMQPRSMQRSLRMPRPGRSYRLSADRLRTAPSCSRYESPRSRSSHWCARDR
jgi:hypothetical protein